MLSRFKIGQKLKGGFACVLVLLIVVWLMGRSALHQNLNNLNNILTAETLSTTVLEMEIDLLQALVSSRDLTINREKQHADQIQKRVADILTKYANVDNMDAKEVAEMNKLLQQVTEFGKLEADVWKIEEERTATAASRERLAQAVIKDLEALEKNIHQSTLERHTSTQDNRAYWAADRVALEREIGNMTNGVREVQMLSFQSDNARSEARRAALMTEIQNIYRAIEEAQRRVQRDSEAEAYRQQFASLNRLMQEWRGYVV